MDEPEDIMLNQINQSQNDNTTWFHLYEVSKIDPEKQRVE